MIKNASTVDHETNEDSLFGFGEVIHAYTRKEAIADGVQVDVNERFASDLKEAGILFPVYMTATVFADCVCPIEPSELELATCQDMTGRFWDILTMLKFGIKRSRDPQYIEFQVKVVPNVPKGKDRHPRAKTINLVATCGPVDIDDPRPAITISYPGE